jgi:hypothetical protein
MPRATILSGGIDARFRVCSALSALCFWNPAAARSSGVPAASWLRSVAQPDKAVNETVNNAAVTMILVLALRAPVTAGPSVLASSGFAPLEGCERDEDRGGGHGQ